MRKFVGRLFLFALMLAAVPVKADDLPEGMVAVRYGLDVIGWKPVTGESFCKVGQDCQIGFDFDPVKVVLRLEWSGSGTLTFACVDRFAECLVGRSSTQQFQYVENPFSINIWRGDGGVTHELVLRYSQRIGVVFLQYARPHRPNKRTGPAPIEL